MHEIEVIARHNTHGKIIPVSFMWQERTHKIDSIGRSWNANDGLHILVMDQRNQVFHLILRLETEKWYLLQVGNPRPLPRA